LVVADLIDLEGFAQSLRGVRTSFKRTASAARENWGNIGCLAIPMILFVSSGAYIALYGFSEFARTMQCVNPNVTPEIPCTLAEQRKYGLQFLPFQILIAAGTIAGGLGSVLLLAFIIGVVIPELVLKPLTWVLRILPRWAKVLNLLLIVVGFHFNLLAS
jgi:hypothetical protein